MKNKFTFLSVITMIAFMLVGCTSAQEESNSGEDTDKEVQPIAIQGAMDVEVSALLEAMGEYKEEKHGNYSFYVGEIEEIPVVVSRTEIGMVNAATSTTLLIDEYNPRMIINQGTAGGHDPDVHELDIVIGTEIVNIGAYRSEHLDAGQGSAPETWIPMSTTLREASGEEEKYMTFSSDAELVQVVKNVADQYEHGKVVEGTIGSGDVWNREIDRINWFHENLGTSAEEMETFAVAQVAKLFEVPFLSMRIISNSEVTPEEFEDLPTAGVYGAEFTVEVVKEIGK